MYLGYIKCQISFKTIFFFFQFNLFYSKNVYKKANLSPSFSSQVCKWHCGGNVHEDMSVLKVFIFNSTGLKLKKHPISHD